jgi:hypothetical protein
VEYKTKEEIVLFQFKQLGNCFKSQPAKLRTLRRHKSVIFARSSDGSVTSVPAAFSRIVPHCMLQGSLHKPGGRGDAKGNGSLSQASYRSMDEEPLTNRNSVRDTSYRAVDVFTAFKSQDLLG